jgi:hypothetical protein
MTEYLADSDEGQRWVPTFAERAHRHWGDAERAVALIRRIANGDVDGLSGRIMFASDDLAAVVPRTADADARRLRIHDVC